MPSCSSGLQRDSEQEEILRLSRTPPRLVIIDDLPQPLYYPGPINRFGTAYNVAMNRWIWQHYREVERFALARRWLYILVASVPAASVGSSAMECESDHPGGNMSSGPDPILVHWGRSSECRTVGRGPFG